MTAKKEYTPPKMPAIVQGANWQILDPNMFGVNHGSVVNNELSLRFGRQIDADTVVEQAVVSFTPNSAASLINILDGYLRGLSKQTLEHYGVFLEAGNDGKSE